MAPRPAEGDSWACPRPPRPALGPAHCTPVYRCPSLSKLCCLEEPSGTSLLLGYFGAVNDSVCLSNDLKCSTAPDPTPMPCAQQPLPWLSPAGGEAPWHVSLPALVQSPMCPWPWLLVLHGMTGGTQCPQVSGLGVGDGKTCPPAPESVLPPS